MHPPHSAPAAAPAEGPSRAALPRRLGLLSAIAVVIGSIIGSGIFRSPAGIADRLPGPIPMLSIWVLGGLFALCGTLTLAEIASAIPKTGGIYAYLREAWGRGAAFLFGWAQLVVIRAAAGLAAYLRDTGAAGGPVVIGYDAWTTCPAIGGVSNTIALASAS